MGETKGEVKKEPFYKGIFFQIVVAIILGTVVGYLWPSVGNALQPVGEGFIKLIKMIIAPLIFGVVVVGIAKVGNIKTVGRIGGKTLLYFEVVTTFALIIGVVVANMMNPGSTMNVDPSTLSTATVEEKTNGSDLPSEGEFFLNMIPDSAIGAFANNSMLQVLLISCLFGIALVHIGGRTSEVLLDVLEKVNNVLFKIMSYIIKLTALATFSAMAFAVSQYGIGTLASFGKLFVAMTVACFLFILVLAVIVRITIGLSLWKIIVYIKEEILLAFATGSTEAVMPQLMDKFEQAGCNKAVVGLVVPTGYSFNLDGASIYLSIALVFLAQATGVDLSLGEQLLMLGILLLTSKGMAGIPGSAFVALSATAAAMGSIPVAAVALMLAPDRFMGNYRTTVNIIGYAVATFIISSWEKLLDKEQARAMLEGELVYEPKNVEIEENFDEVTTSSKTVS
ncbi:cation:dicarboxylate symporter family transporter [Priestia endophytica]|jgi:aerobic C4-dicarboxylate transport protein|uniref:Aerobic C4-dicarboxylate transport protein n=1 Tax=Priestia endophytica DSM 13796 TaxID=1121089 RepID=A0A1I6BLU2_9BACI|nr:cation:dicarboxylase symporter family transporter [Priestia endophytica]KYG35349.1 C4-dicarboxylate transporter [Priestia endophytica]MBG9810451.1 C4-dicarboxylate transporter [Priestia endophytica]MCM3540629.1 cation:dicarboxylase symporter family transporter [Priestia endophytica]RAS78434.1 C4-dicarboxylate transporter DctA [Priestia endophytica]SFQ81787.1 aerobic C4-dicarboxylate transport protein [Priestia endophytica DSM 13796]